MGTSSAGGAEAAAAAPACRDADPCAESACGSVKCVEDSCSSILSYGRAGPQLNMHRKVSAPHAKPSN